MDIAQAVAGIEQHLRSFVASATEKIEQELPVLGDAASKIATNPVVQAVAQAEHLGQVPELLQVFAAMIAQADAAIAASKAQGAAEAQAAAAAATPQA